MVVCTAVEWLMGLLGVGFYFAFLPVVYSLVTLILSFYISYHVV